MRRLRLPAIGSSTHPVLRRTYPLATVLPPEPTGSKPLDDNNFEAELATIEESSFNIHRIGARLVFKHDENLRTKLLAAGQLTAQPADSGAFQQAGESFTRLVTDAGQLLAAGQMAEAVRLREGGLRLAFERYVESTTKVADVLQDESLRASDDFSARTGSASRLVLGFASWPLLAVAGLLLVGALFLLVFLVLFRGRDLNEGP